MNAKQKYTIYSTFIIIYILLLIYNYFQHSEWMLDNLIAIGFLTFMLYINRWIQLSKTEFLSFNAALFIHNLGSFGFYEWSYGFLQYDMVVHFISSIVTACIVFNLIMKKYTLSKKKTSSQHILLVFFLVISAVTFLGILVELLEFGGFVFLGPGDGILFVGAGDSGHSLDIALQYIDTMTDIIVNLIGSIFGAFFFYILKYRKHR